MLTNLEHVVFRDRVSFCVLCIIMREKQDVLLHALHRKIVTDNIVILKLGI